MLALAILEYRAPEVGACLMHRAGIATPFGLDKPVRDLACNVADCRAL